MLSSIGFALVIAFQTSVFLPAQCLSDITPELNRYLWCYQIVNTFDSAAVAYEVGDFALDLGDVETILCFLLSRKCDRFRFHCSPAQCRLLVCSIPARVTT